MIMSQAIDVVTIDVGVAIHQDELANRYQNDDVAVEVPVALTYNTISHAVMMATPTDLADFATGFSLTEGIIEHADEIRHIYVQPDANGITVRMMISDEKLGLLRKIRRRNLVVGSSCGLCGIKSFKQMNHLVKPVQPVQVSDGVIQNAIKSIQQYQPLQQKTGATHAAAWCDLSGNIILTREDVGRHNALDKLIGAHIKACLPIHNGFVLITSRASYEMVHKSAHAGFGCLVAVSAPTSLAIEQAQKLRIKLIGFARDGRHVIYYDPFKYDENACKVI